MSKERTLLIKMVYTAIFIALCFGATFISIPFGTSKVHLGNFVCILCGLLCGPLIGGLAGSLGMGFNDIMLGYAWTTFLRTFILKFLMGFLSGLLFRVCLKKKSNGWILMGSSFVILLGLLGYSIYMYFVPKSGYTIVTIIGLSSLIGILLVSTIASFWLPSSSKPLLFSLTISLAVNVAGEFFLRILFSLAVGTTYEAALATSIAKLPAALFTSAITVILIILFFYPIYFATRKFNKLDDLSNYTILQRREAHSN